jgi:flagellar basal body-associated protein FliL
MSDKKADAKAEAPAPAAAPEQPAKKSPVKPIAIVAVLMIAEAAGVYMFVGKTGPQPAAAAVEGKEEAGKDALVEIPLIEDKFQNLQTGRVWVWDSEIVLKAKSKNQEFVAKQLEERTAEIKEGVSQIFRRAQHGQLKEPGLETINRQITAFMSQILGKDGEGKERLERVVIPKCKGFPAD